MAFEKAGNILRDAYKNGYGVAAFNIFNYETIQLAILTAEEEKKPVIIAFYPGFLNYISFDVVADITRSMARRVSVPVGLHLDHCHDLATIVQAMDAGFDSVMYDGSRLPFDENVRTTLEVVQAAKARGIDVEAELGAVGSAANAADFSDSAKFTTVEEAAEFCERTGCTSLAVAVGNAHGNYVQEPKLDLPRIKAISTATGIPVVLHGGSGIPDGQISSAIKNGIAKINVATEYHQAYFQAVANRVNTSQDKDMYTCAKKAAPDIRSFLAQKINLFSK